MNNRPYGHELLNVARRTLLDELLPLLSAEKTYEALMVANAMAIAARELEPHSRRDDQADKRIARFYHDIGLKSTSDATETTESIETIGAAETTRAIDPNGANDATERGLAAQIRQRAIDKSHDARLHDLLLSLTRSKLAISNPKYLPQSPEPSHEQ